MTGAFADLCGRGVGITGGGSQLARALALGLAEAGAVAVICGRSRDALDAVAVEATGRRLAGRVIAQPADLCRDAELEGVLDCIEKQTGAVYGWVNGAFAGDAECVSQLARASADATFSAGLTDLLLATQAAARRMKPHREGTIVNVASMYGQLSQQPELDREFPERNSPPGYRAAVAGVIQFTRYAACHLGADGIRVNCLSPGPFSRDAVREKPAVAAELCRRVPLGRLADAAEIVGPALFLLSRASSFVAGHNLVVDGGWSAW